MEGDKFYKGVSFGSVKGVIKSSFILNVNGVEICCGLKKSKKLK